MNFGQWEGRPWSEIIIGEGTEEFFLRYIEGAYSWGRVAEDAV